MDLTERREWDRINFVADRDGIPAARAFAEQGVGQYESAIREADSGGNGYGAAYRESLLASIRVYRQYLEQKD
ncbi:hypothetical protein QPM17_09715 [Marinobacter sp. TBZ242]|uniref:Uncharacterized protein n=1 Tax=Marinobacter azerbaijanicus TaxID=3050455 RepID=A0ABT7IB71_9GAMM|nr:hypothetical protein [Marinobacter sp. TBZ242]MDL0431406.1 hypothetical protein [Marinobacter sp. TBZ242]